MGVLFQFVFDGAPLLFRIVFTGAPLLGVFCFISGLSIGPLYTPAATLLVAGVIGLIPTRAT